MHLAIRRYTFNCVQVRLPSPSCHVPSLPYRKETNNTSHSHTNPRGYLEIQDTSNPVCCDDDTVAGTSVLKFSKLFLKASINLGARANSAESCKKMMEEIGYVDVVEITYKWLVNRWPKYKKMKEVGLCDLSLSIGWE